MQFNFLEGVHVNIDKVTYTKNRISASCIVDTCLPCDPRTISCKRPS